MIRSILDNPALYRVWQLPFARQKLAPALADGVLLRARSVLDIGCGPGTNAAIFSRTPGYVGVDLSEKYIDYARRHFGGAFQVQDVRHWQPTDRHFEAVLMNSLMHHLDDAGARSLLVTIPTMLENDGTVHIVDLVRADVGIPRWLAQADRGKHARTAHEWCALVSEHLKIRGCREYSISIGGVALWRLVYLRAVKNEEVGTEACDLALDQNPEL